MRQQGGAVDVAEAAQLHARVDGEADDLEPLVDRLARRHVVLPFAVAVRGAGREEGDVRAALRRQPGEVEEEGLGAADGAAHGQAG
jgi:hypothetical protein